MNLSTHVKPAIVLGPQAVGTASETSSLIDMQGFEGVAGILSAGAITDGTTAIKAQGGNEANGSDLADLAGTETLVSANQAAVLDVYRPEFRYIAFVAVRGGETGAVINGITALQYGADVKPPAQDPSVTNINLAVSPVYGTALA